MRSAGSGVGREDGFVAMDAEANRLKESKAPKEQGSVEEFDGGYRADVQWLEEGCKRHVHGPRRAEKRRALEDLEAMRSAQFGTEEAAVRLRTFKQLAHDMCGTPLVLSSQGRKYKTHLAKIGHLNGRPIHEWQAGIGQALKTDGIQSRMVVGGRPLHNKEMLFYGTQKTIEYLLSKPPILVPAETVRQRNFRRPFIKTLLTISSFFGRSSLKHLLFQHDLKTEIQFLIPFQ